VRLASLEVRNLRCLREVPELLPHPEFNLITGPNAVDGKYPDYRTVVPTERKLRAEVSREALIKAAERIIPVTDELTQAVILTFKGGENLEIGARNNKGDTGEEQVEMKIDRDDGAEEEVKISINIKYLIDSLQALGGSDAVLAVNDGSSSMLITPSEGSSKHIIMPMKA